MPRPTTYRALLLTTLLVTGIGVTRADPREDFFEAKIRPVLAGTCYRCHGDAKTSGALRVDSRTALVQGGDSGPAVSPGKPDESLLLRAIQRDESVSAMPPDRDKALRPDQIADFRQWIQDGAVWPAKTARFEAARHWSFEPIRVPRTPSVRDAAWLQTSVDPFLRSRQESAGANPIAPADRRTLLRRAAFDLTGLPPAADDVEAFQHDPSPDAFNMRLDRLLAYPAYGERWGRHWLDVVRYADTAGETADYPVPSAWRYRNYVIDAFNADKPYDTFLQEQIAGDILATAAPTEQFAERVTATGYLAISRRFGFDSENYHHLTIQDTVDSLGQSVLGLSLGCARCHDHKFDPVSMHDYYALYGIFDSSRYSFPGSEQKQKVRSLAPLVPPAEANRLWRDYTTRVASLAAQLTQLKQPVPPGVLRSLHDLDGDFELQAPAAGGSKGVLVPPWIAEGPLSITTAAQSPYKNVYGLGRVGVSVSAGADPYRLEQAIPWRVADRTAHPIHVNLDFRIAAVDRAAQGAHRVTLGNERGVPAIELLITAEALSIQSGDQLERIAALSPGVWNNLQLTIDLSKRSFSGRSGVPGAITEFSPRPFTVGAAGTIDFVAFTSVAGSTAVRPALELDQFAVLDDAIPAVSAEVPRSETTPSQHDAVALSEQLQKLAGNDGDLELQSRDTPPARPWNPGPNSQVRVAAQAQSPYVNVFPKGELGVHAPNRGEYDGFGLTLTNVKPDDSGQLFVSFDFRCVEASAGGNGSWRYYLGHGPGNSAAIELFFNDREFFQRSANEKKSVGPLALGTWYQVQLTLDTKQRTYSGVLASPTSRTSFSGQLATGWDGAFDYTFIDSYGHIGGVRPSLDADNFYLGHQPIPPLDTPLATADANSVATRREKIAELRRQLSSLQSRADDLRRELETLLIHGPFPLTYGMAEGTPHNARLQLRGEPEQLAATVPRGTIRVLGGGPLPETTRGSGRRELAEWLTRPDHPLTARVMANRVWQYHFGRGLVKTPNDFGARGQPPTHPELLDHLASEFLGSGWSIKSLHRRILGSAAYQQAVVDQAPARGSQGLPVTGDLKVSHGTDSAASTDLYVGFPRRRLSAEEIRDSILAVSGELDHSPGREHPFPVPISWGFSQHAPFSAVYEHRRRSVYLMTQRLKRHPFLALFDGADPNTTTADRLITTVPTQALFFLNDPFVHEMSQRWASHLLVTPSDSPSQVRQAYRTAFGRAPTERELADATEFLAVYRTELAAAQIDGADVRSLAAFLRTLIGSNEFVHVE